MNDIVKSEPQAGDIVEYTPSQIDLIKNTYAKGTTDEELKLFVAVSKRLGLDIFARQVYAIKRWDSKTKREVMTIQTGIDGYRSVAERTGKYAGCDLPIFEYDERNNLISCSIVVKKIVAGHVCSFAAIAYMNEYLPKTASLMWQDRPKGMLAKCAEALALRKAFPLELSGVYTQEETEKDLVQQDHIDNICERAEKTDYKDQKDQLKIIEATCASLTKGMTKEQKAKWVRDSIGCPWGDLQKKTNEELDAIIKRLDKSKDAPIEAESKTITTDTVPWD